MNVNENRKGGLHRLSAVILINTSKEIYQSISSFFTFCIAHATPRLYISVSFNFALSFSMSPSFWLPGRLTAALWGSWNLNQGL